MSAANAIKRLAIVAAWIVIWQLIALIVNNEILLAGPLEVFLTLIQDITTARFWASIGFSFGRIVGGFLIAFVLGVFVGALAGRFTYLREFLEPAVQFIKSVPIVCIIVLLLLWFGSPYVSVLAVFLVAFPPVYFAVLEALRVRNVQLRQMLTVFKVKKWRKALAHDWPSLLPFLVSSGRVAVGMSWKAGIAAELIGLPLGSIGESIYYAKITLSSAELFSWTIVIVLISLACERLFLYVLKRSAAWTWKASLPRYKERLKTTEAQTEDFPPSQQDKVSSSPTNGQGETSLRGSIHVHDVGISFDGHELLYRLTLSLHAGERYSLRGVSGSGKTTLLSVMEGLIMPTTGTLEVNGRISAVFQEARLFEQHTAVENVQLIVGQHINRAQIEVLLQKLLPAKALHKPVYELSGGMRRRVELARALAFPGDFLFLDEPFAGLDAKSKETSVDVILHELQGRTLVVATHDEEDERALGLVPINIPLGVSFPR